MAFDLISLSAVGNSQDELEQVFGFRNRSNKTSNGSGLPWADSPATLTTAYNGDLNAFRKQQTHVLATFKNPLC